MKEKFLKFLVQANEQKKRLLSFLLSLDDHRRRLLIIGVCFLGLLGWMAFFHMETVAVADGKVIPSSMVKVIQNFEGGIISGIHVSTGDKVKAGDPLFSFDPLAYRNEFEAEQKHVEYLSLRLQRLNAEVESAPLKFDSALEKSHPEQAKAERDEYVARMARLQEMQSLLALAEEERSIASNLVKKGLESKLELLRVQKQESERRQTLRIFQEEAVTQATKIRSEIQVKLNLISTLSEKLKRTEVLAPEDGIIGSVSVTTVGGTVKPGDPLAQLVPTNAKMLVEAKLPVSDIAMISVGSKAKVTFSAYDSSIFGSVDAEVVAISPDALTTEAGMSYYVVRMRTLRPIVDTSGKLLPIGPGMAAQARIVTGRRTFLEYIFKPIDQTINNSFRES